MSPTRAPPAAAVRPLRNRVGVQVVGRQRHLLRVVVLPLVVLWSSPLSSPGCQGLAVVPLPPPSAPPCAGGERAVRSFPTITAAAAARRVGTNFIFPTGRGGSQRRRPDNDIRGSSTARCCHLVWGEANTAEASSARNKNNENKKTYPPPAINIQSGGTTPSPSAPLLACVRRLAVVTSVLMVVSFGTEQPALAAPPIAVIAEELGYFPVRNAAGAVVYIPQTVRRPSTAQAVALARYMRHMGSGDENGNGAPAVMAGTYWCPHTSRQKELFGAEAWKELTYLECAPSGYKANPALCAARAIDGYPTWILPAIPTGSTAGSAATATTSSSTTTTTATSGAVTVLSGERSLADLAAAVHYPGAFDAALEEASSPPPLVGAACRP